jgi:hypothetical protein
VAGFSILGIGLRTAMLGRQTLNLELKSRSKGLRCTVGGKMWLQRPWARAVLSTMCKSAQGVGSVLGRSTSGFGVPTLVTFLRRSCLRLEPDRELPPVSTPLALVGAQHDVPADLKAGHVYTLRNHIEVVEDLSFLSGRGSRGDRLIASIAGSLFGAMAPRTQWAKKESMLKLLEEERLCDGTGVMMTMMGIFNVADAAATAVIVVCLVRVVEGAWTTAIVPTASLGTQLPSVVMWGVDAIIPLGAQGEGQVCLFRRPHCYRCLAAGGMSWAS